MAGQHNPPGFGAALLKELGIPATKSRLMFLDVWFANEGNNGPPGANGVNNPLNVSPGGHVANYATQAEGVKATANVLRQSNFASVLAVLRKPGVSPAAIAATVENSPWASSHYGAHKTSGGWVGGHLVSSFLGPTVHQPGITDAVGLATHYAVHPVSGLQVTGTAAKNAVTKPLDKIAMYILYGAAVLGGGFMMVIALILVGADIGIARGVQKNSAYKLGAGAVGYRKRKQQEEDEAAYRQRSYRTSREGGTTKVRVVALGPNATKTDEKMLAKARNEEAVNAFFNNEPE